MSFISPNLRVAARKNAEAINYEQALMRRSPKITDMGSGARIFAINSAGDRSEAAFVGALDVVHTDADYENLLTLIKEERKTHKELMRVRRLIALSRNKPREVLTH